MRNLFAGDEIQRAAANIVWGTTVQDESTILQSRRASGQFRHAAIHTQGGDTHAHAHRLKL